MVWTQEYFVTSYGREWCFESGECDLRTSKHHEQPYLRKFTSKFIRFFVYYIFNNEAKTLQWLLTSSCSYSSSFSLILFVRSPIFAKRLTRSAQLSKNFVFSHFLSVVQHRFGLIKQKTNVGHFVLVFNFNACWCTYLHANLRIALYNLKCTLQPIYALAIIQSEMIYFAKNMIKFIITYFEVVKHATINEVIWNHFSNELSAFSKVNLK